jgi:predicted RNA-binding Zn ribbon-like protein
VDFELTAGRPVLDFVATVADRGTTHVERLRTADDLAAWVAQARLVDDLPAVSEDQLARAKEVREALFGLVSALVDGSAPDRADLGLVNEVAAGPRPVLRLSSTGAVRRLGDLDVVLAALAVDCIDLFDSPDRAHLRWCADSTCTRAFVDRSRGHRRRWCGMKGCGDRAKAAAYRQRRREGQRSAAPTG